MSEVSSRFEVMSAAPLTSASDAEERVEVLDLAPAEALSFVTDRRRATDLAAAQELEGVAHWADLHRVGRDDLLRGEVGAVDPEFLEALPCRPRATTTPTSVASASCGSPARARSWSRSTPWPSSPPHSG